MNPKNALFLSAALTAFVLAILFGVVTKITTAGNLQAAAAAEPTIAETATEEIIPTDIPAPTETAVPTTAAVLPPTPDEAALLAAKAIDRQDVYSVETFNYNGVDCYKVVFVSGDVVYIGMDQKVLEMTKLQVASTYTEPTQVVKKHRKTNNDNNNNNPDPNPKPPSDDHHDEGHDD